jgi:hypothetical protein
LRKSGKNIFFRKRFLIHASNSPYPACYEKPFSEVSTYKVSTTNLEIAGSQWLIAARNVSAAGGKKRSIYNKYCSPVGKRVPHPEQRSAAGALCEQV